MKKSTSNIVKGFCAILLLGGLAVSCRQDPIFHVISTETAPIPPRIAGAPTNMVVFEREYQVPVDPADPDFDPDAVPETKTITLLFVASGRLHWYGSPDPATESPKWDRDYGIPRPGGKVIALAVTKTRLYALCLSSGSLRATLRYTTKTCNDTWHPVSRASEYPLIQSIYSTYSDGDGEGGQLFAGARKSSKNTETYAILYLDSSTDTLQKLKSDTEMLSGAVYRKTEGIYYMCTRGNGIYRVKKTDLETNSVSDTTVLQLKNIRKAEIQVEIDPGDPPSDPDEPPEIQIEIQPVIQERNNRIVFMNIIKLKDSAESIIAIGRDGGVLHEILTNDALVDMFDDVPDSAELLEDLKESRAFSQIFYINSETGNPSGNARTGGFATGAFALWEDPLNSATKLLVAGRQGTLFSTSYNNGYIEFKLTSDGSFDKENPSRGMLTVDNSDRYSTSLEKQPINHLFQVPVEVDTRKIFFASTQTGGLWSYRNRSSNGGWQWNAED